MSKIKRCLIAATVIICGVAAIILAYPRQDAATKDPLSGTWMAQDAGYNIFDGQVNMVKVFSKPGSIRQQMLVVYDKTRRALLCGKIEETRREFVCQAILLNRDEITSEDRADLINDGTIKDIPPLIVDFARSEDTLEIKGVPVTEEKCLENESCEYLLLSRLSC